jgi:hypothetical protein
VSCLDGVDRVADSATSNLGADCRRFEYESRRISVLRTMTVAGELEFSDDIYSWDLGLLPNSPFSMSNYYWQETRRKSTRLF